MIKIESNIPIPERALGGLTSALKQLKVGDSFVYPKNKRASISPFQKRLGMKFQTRAISATEVRVWRTV